MQIGNKLLTISSGDDNSERIYDCDKDRVDVNPKIDSHSIPKSFNAF